MILSEKIETFFNDKEVEKIQAARSIQSKYNSMDDSVDNPYSPNVSNTMEFTINDDINSAYDAALSGVVDYANGQFVIKKVVINATEANTLDIVKRLLNSAIVNLEQNNITVGLIYWRINKQYTDYLKAALDMGFTIQDTNTYSFEVVYYLQSFPARQNSNTVKVMDIANRMKLNTGEY